MQHKESFGCTRAAETPIYIYNEANRLEAAQTLLDIGTVTQVADTLINLQKDASRLEATHAAQTLLEICQLDIYLSRRAERDLRSPQDTENEAEGEQNDHHQHKCSNGYVQELYTMHRKKDCRARCIDDCNGKRKINAKIKEGLSIYTIIDVCEPDCSKIVPRCKEGCSFIKKYNAQVAGRLAELGLVAKIQVKKRRIISLRRMEQGKVARDAAVLIRRIERKITDLVEEAKDPAALQLKLAISDAALQFDGDDESDGSGLGSVSNAEAKFQDEIEDDEHLSFTDLTQHPQQNGVQKEQLQSVLERKRPQYGQQQVEDLAANSDETDASHGNGKTIKRRRTMTYHDTQILRTKDGLDDDDDSDQSEEYLSAARRRKPTRSSRHRQRVGPRTAEQSKRNSYSAKRFIQYKKPRQNRDSSPAAASPIANKSDATNGLATPENPFDKNGRRRGDKSKRDVEVFQEYQKWLSTQGQGPQVKRLELSMPKSSPPENSGSKGRRSMKTTSPEQRKSLVVKLRCPAQFLSG